MSDQTFGTFYDSADHDGKPPLISHVSAYVQGNYNPQWAGCVETTVSGTFGKDRNRKARDWRLALELRRVELASKVAAEETVQRRMAAEGVTPQDIEETWWPEGPWDERGLA